MNKTIITIDDTSKTKSIQLYETKNDMKNECDTYLKAIGHNKSTNIVDKCSWKSSFLIPGSSQTNINGSFCSKMFVQGICRFKADNMNYILIGAYDRSDTYNSVIYVEKIIDDSPTYVKTLVLEDKSHCGGLAFDGTNLWICSNNHYIKGVKWSTLKKAINSKNKSENLKYDYSTNDLGFNVNYLTYAKDKLWAGQCNNNSPKMFGYTINNKSQNKPTLTKSLAMFVPDYTEGVTIHNDGKTFFTTSHTDSTESGEKKYMSSKLIVYNPSWNNPTYNNNLKINVIPRNNNIKNYFLPPMAEGICLTTASGTAFYIIFESIAKGSTGPNFKTDRVLRFSISNVL